MFTLEAGIDIDPIVNTLAVVVMVMAFIPTAPMRISISPYSLRIRRKHGQDLEPVESNLRNESSSQYYKMWLWMWSDPP
jgi:hypothetical protein